LMSPVSPFFADWLYRSLNENRRAMLPADSPWKEPSVHLTLFVSPDTSVIDEELERRMELAQQVCSLVRSVRKRVKLNIRQPLSRILIPLTAARMEERISAVSELICSEVNIKAIEFVEGDNDLLTRQVKANFRTLGPKLGPRMKQAAAAIEALNDTALRQLAADGQLTLKIEGGPLTLEREDVEIRTEDVPGWASASEGSLTVALDVNLTEELLAEGLARELINRIQNLRKELDFEVTDRIHIRIQEIAAWSNAWKQFGVYIEKETLATGVKHLPTLESETQIEIEGVIAAISLTAQKLP